MRPLTNHAWCWRSAGAIILAAAGEMNTGLGCEQIAVLRGWADGSPRENDMRADIWRCGTEACT